MPIAQEVGKALKDYNGTIWVGGNDDKAQGMYIECLWSESHFVKTPSDFVRI